MRTRWTRRLLVLAALVIAVVALRFTVFRTDPVPVTVFRVARGRVEETVTNSKAGSVRSRHRASLSPDIGGRVAALWVHKGDRVRAGQMLLQLQDTDYRAQVVFQEKSLEAARAAASEACRAAEQAERDLGRYMRLSTEEIVSREVLDQFESRRDMTRSACEAAKARTSQAASSLEIARVSLSKTVLKAPFDGVVADLSTEVGEWITPSPPGVPIPPVVEVIDTEAIYVSAPLDEVDVGKVRAGLTARVTMDSYPGRSFPGRVTRVAPYVTDREEQSRTFEIEVTLDDRSFSRTLVPGSSADVEVILDAREDVLRIPSFALMEGARVLVVRDGMLVSTVVKTGLRNWEFVEVAQGLAPGDEVVTSLDRAEVKDGARAVVSGETVK